MLVQLFNRDLLQLGRHFPRQTAEISKAFLVKQGYKFQS